eukprot:GFKZ01007382.1.p1 GENE.GFKZ01007382.1~~GFKZ01007382.1.p1  ORF type:complete len:299 (+),score=41.99 GFKZ01007382.1:202-1098(+)
MESVWVRMITAVVAVAACVGGAVGGRPPEGAPPGSLLPGVEDWRFERHAPGWCGAMVARPILERGCRRNRDTMRCANGEYMMFSQMGQDYYLYTRHFSKLGRRGVYLDVATNDPVAMSNTFFMESCLGWKGLCVEAHPQYLGAIHRWRNCALVPMCVSDKDGRKVEFALDRGLSGVVETNKNKPRWERLGTRVESIKMACSTMKVEMERYGVKVVDYLSLDVEGHELNVLKGIDWDNVKINVMTVEAQGDRLRQVEEFLKGKGYLRHVPDLSAQSKRTRSLSEDAVFLHSTVEFGKPV